MDGKERRLKGDVTRDDLQRRFLTQLIISTLLQHCFEGFQHCSNIATLCCAKSRACESSRLCYTGRFATANFNATHHFSIVPTLLRSAGQKILLANFPCNITLKHDMFKSFKVAGIDVASFTRFRSLSVDGWKRSKNSSMDTELPSRFC